MRTLITKIISFGAEADALEAHFCESWPAFANVVIPHCIVNQNAFLGIDNFTSRSYIECPLRAHAAIIGHPILICRAFDAFTAIAEILWRARTLEIFHSRYDHFYKVSLGGI